MVRVALRAPLGLSGERELLRRLRRPCLSPTSSREEAGRAGTLGWSSRPFRPLSVFCVATSPSYRFGTTCFPCCRFSHHTVLKCMLSTIHRFEMQTHTIVCKLFCLHRWLATRRPGAYQRIVATALLARARRAWTSRRSGETRRARKQSVCAWRSPQQFLVVMFCAAAADTANLRTKILAFRGFDSGRILILRGGILMSIGNFPEMLSQRILVWKAELCSLP